MARACRPPWKPMCAGGHGGPRGRGPRSHLAKPHAQCLLLQIQSPAQGHQVVTQVLHLLPQLGQRHLQGLALLLELRGAGGGPSVAAWGGRGPPGDADLAPGALTSSSTLWASCWASWPASRLSCRKVASSSARLSSRCPLLSLGVDANTDGPSAEAAPSQSRAMEGAWLLGPEPSRRPRGTGDGEWSQGPPDGAPSPGACRVLRGGNRNSRPRVPGATEKGGSDTHQAFCSARRIRFRDTWFCRTNLVSWITAWSRPRHCSRRRPSSCCRAEVALSPCLGCPDAPVAPSSCRPPRAAPAAPAHAPRPAPAASAPGVPAPPAGCSPPAAGCTPRPSFSGGRQPPPAVSGGAGGGVSQPSLRPTGPHLLQGQEALLKEAAQLGLPL